MLTGVDRLGGNRFHILGVARKFFAVGGGHWCGGAVTVRFMRIWAGGLATELVSCVDGLMSGPPADWSPEPDDEQARDQGDVPGAQWGEQSVPGEVF